MKKLVLLFVLAFSASVFSKSITLINYNVENLFDTIHDEGKNDYTYLPLALKKKSPSIRKYCLSLAKKSWRDSCLYTDWSDSVLNKKLKNITRVLNSIKNGADIIVLQEVENLNVLKMLVKELKNSEYKYVSLLEGPDNRGIDNGIISKYPISNVKLHKIDLRSVSKRKTRDILEATINVDGKQVTLFANHWPSQGSPSEAREIAAKELVKVSSRSTADLTIALGDFNTLKKDSPHGIQRHVLSHFYDAHVEALRGGTTLRPGSHWFRGNWSRLDRLFVHKNSKAKVNYSKFNIYSKPFMFTDLEWTDYNTGEVTVYNDVPFRFNNRSNEGFSDHLPLMIEFDI